MGKPIHVYPINDLKTHDTESLNCDCMPKIVNGEADDKTGMFELYGVPIIIHNAWDGRK